MNTELVKNIDWVGYVDWTVRDFHGYRTQHGATYNAYLVRDKKTALIDTVKAQFGHDLIDNVKQLVDPADIDYVICNHAEPDHAGALPEVMNALPNAVLVCNKKCEAILAEHFDTSGIKFQLVKTGDSISLGERTLEFIETPMVHWPESMFTYVPEEKLLFSMDAFGQHYASSNRFDDEVPLETVILEAKIYYANIVMSYGKQVGRLLDKASGMDIEIIAPSHGVIWRTHLGRIIEEYGKWAACKPEAKVMVVYDTMWGSTATMARAIYDGAVRDDVEVQLIDIRKSDLTTIADQALDTAVFAFGTSTLNMEMMPMASAVLTYLKGLQPVDKAAFAFGSFGWGKVVGPDKVDEVMRSMKWEILREPIKSKYRPSPEVLAECMEAGRMIAGKAKEMAENS